MHVEQYANARRILSVKTNRLERGLRDGVLKAVGEAGEILKLYSRRGEFLRFEAQLNKEPRAANPASTNSEEGGIERTNVAPEEFRTSIAGEAWCGPMPYHTVCSDQMRSIASSSQRPLLVIHTSVTRKLCETRSRCSRP